MNHVFPQVIPFSSLNHSIASAYRLYTKKKVRNIERERMENNERGKRQKGRANTT
jgi:hypothetical protein